MTRLRIHGAQLATALLLSFALWTFVSLSTNPTSSRTIGVPVQAVGLSPGLVVVNSGTGLPEPVSAITTLTVRGPEEAVDELGPTSFQVFANLQGLAPGILHRVALDVEGPDDVRVTDRRPAEITVRIARELVRTVPITVTPEGQPPFSFREGAIRTGATEANVRGPEDLVRRVTGAVATVDLQNQTRDVSTMLPLTPIDSAGEPVEGVSVTPELVQVDVPIAAQVGVQHVSVVPDIRGQPAPGYGVGGIDWAPKIVEVLTSGLVTGTFSTEEINLDGLTGAITRTVEIERPPNVITRPPTVPVTVWVSIEPISVQSQVPFSVVVASTGLDQALDASADPAALQLTLAGPFEQLSQLTAGDLVATVDLTGLGPGVHLVPVQVQVPPDLDVSVIGPVDPVTVTITPKPLTPTPDPSPTVAPASPAEVTATAGPAVTR